MITITEARALAAILAAIDAPRHSRARWEASSGRVVTAVVRNLTDHNGNLWHDSNGDVRDAYLWLSGTWETFIPVRELMTMIREGTFVLDYA